MKNSELTSIGVHEMSTTEMVETDGGIIWLLVVGGVLLLGASSCNRDVTYIINDLDGSNEVQQPTDSIIKKSSINNVNDK